MPTLGGSIFTHNVMQFDYCFRESIACLAELCDSVVVLDAESNDGTLDELRKIAAADPKIKLVEGAVWDCAPKHERLRVLANQAMSHLQTDWHFMLQADEVIHEASFPAIRQLTLQPKNRSFAVRRFNLYGDFDHYVGLKSAAKPCNDEPIRLAHTGIPAMGDAESLDMQQCSWEHIDKIQIFHYGLVRKSEALIDKILEMQAWFHGPGHADPRVVEMKAQGSGWQPFKIIAKTELERLTTTHPKYMVDWINERKEDKKIVWMQP